MVYPNFECRPETKVIGLAESGGDRRVRQRPAGRPTPLNGLQVKCELPDPEAGLEREDH